MEFPSLGVHCAVGSCSKLDFLPFECDCCYKIFCQEHRNYEHHDCSESYIKDKRVPICPLCNQPIPVKSGEDPNIYVNQHIMRDCKEKKDKLYSNRCSFPGCKKKELVPVRCSLCHKNYCIKHRFETDHQCQGQSSRSQSTRPITTRPISTKPVASGRNPSSNMTNHKRPQTSLMTQIGADLNKERQQRQFSNQQPHHVSKTSQTRLSEDEALALAISASVNEKTQIQSKNNPTGASSSTQNLDEDEALALAIAASLNEDTNNKKQTQTSTHRTQPSSSKTSSEESNCTIS